MNNQKSILQMDVKEFFNGRRMLLYLLLLLNFVIFILTGGNTDQPGLIHNLAAFLFVGFLSIVGVLIASFISSKNEYGFYIINFAAFGLLIIQLAFLIFVYIGSDSPGAGPGVGMMYALVWPFFSFKVAGVLLGVGALVKYLKSKNE